MRIRDVLRPVVVNENRYYIGSKLHKRLFIINVAAFLFFAGLFALIAGAGWMLFVILVVLIGSMQLVQYFFFDKGADYLSWRFLWRRFYEPPEKLDRVHKTMKELEDNPSHENRQKLKAFIDEEKVK